MTQAVEGQAGDAAAGRRSGTAVRPGVVATSLHLLTAAPAAVPNLFLGPIFQREVVGAGRRRGPYALRFLYAVILLIVASVAFSASWSSVAARSSGVALAQSLQQIAPQITFALGWCMFITMAVVAPALTGGAIADEKRARTLPTLMTTPLSSVAIIVGKLSARTAQLMILGLLAAPLLLAVRLYGGVPAETVLAITAISLSTALLGAALGLMYSIWHKRGPGAMLFAIVTMGLIMFGPMLTWGALTGFRAAGPPGGELMATCAPLCLGALQQPALGASAFGLPLWLANTIFNSAAALLVIWFSAIELRRVMIAEASGEPVMTPKAARRVARRYLAFHQRLPQVSWPIRVLAWALIFTAGGALGAYVGDIGGLLLVWIGLSALVVAFDVMRRIARRGVERLRAEGSLPERGAARRSREVGEAPVLWRELRQSSLGTRQRTILAIAIAIAVPALLWIRWGPAEQGVHASIAIICLLAAMLQGALLTTSAVGAEREAGSWDTLLTTPLAPRDILLGKFLGTLRRQWLLLSVIVADLGLAALGRWIPPVLVLQAVIIFAGPVILLSASGLLMSMLLRRTTLAAIWNLGFALSVWIGSWLAIGLFAWVTSPANDLAEGLVHLNLINSPPAMMGFAVDGALNDWRNDYYIGDWEVTAGGFTIAAIVGSGLQIGAGLLMIAFAVRQFNRLTGRPS